MASDIENVTILDSAVSKLKQYYKAGESDSITFVLGVKPQHTDWLETQQILGNLEGMETTTTSLPAEVVRKLNSLISDNTEGGYFVKDLINSDETKEKLESFISDIGKVEAPSWVDSVESKDIIQIIYEAGASDLEICDSVTSLSSFINQSSAQVSGESGAIIQDNNSFEVNSEEESSRINSPGLAAFVLPNHKFSLSTRNTDAVSLFLNSIPTIEMSRCVPYLDIKFITPVDPTVEQERKEVSILNFLGFNNSDDDGIRLGEVGTVPSEFAEEILNTADEQFVNISTAGMELFTSPQTMINPNSPGGFDKMIPFMTLDQFTVSINAVGNALLSDQRGGLKFTLHDRSRLAEIAPLVAPERFGTTYLSIEYGWSHPDSNPDTNVYGYLINSMRSKGNFTVLSTNFSLGDDGQISLNMDLANRPTSDVKLFPISCGAFMPISPIRSLINSLLSKQQAFKVNQNLNWEQVEVHPKLTLLSEDPIAGGSMIPRGIFKTVIAAMDKAGGITADQFISEISGLTKDTILGAKDASILAEISRKNVRLLKTNESGVVPDPFFPQAFHQAQKSSFQFKYPTASISEAIVEDGWSSGSSGGFVSLGKIFMEYVGSPLAACGKYDEVQMFFYRFNSKSGAARLYDSLASFVVYAPEFEIKVGERLVAGDESLSIERFISIFNEAFIEDDTDPNYGISQLRGAQDSAEENGASDSSVAADLRVLNSRITDALKMIYREGGGEAAFKPPRLGIYLEDVPRIVPSDDSGEDPVRRHVNFSQSIARVHIYDINASPYDHEEFILRAATKGQAVVRVTGDSPISRPFRPMGINDALSSAVDKELLKKSSTSEEGDLESFVTNVPSTVIKDLIKQTVPSLTIGQGFNGIQSFSMAATTSGQVNDTLLVEMMRNKRGVGDTSVANRVSGVDPIVVIPASVNMTTFGCPLVEYASKFFVDLGSNTTADNFYIVNKINHTISSGRFDTSLGLGFADSGTIRNVRAILSAQAVQSD